MYIYQADQYCDDCGEKFKEGLPLPDYEKPWDTDDYPMHVQDSGETDSPCNCGICGAPLDYTLTNEGVEYVLNSIQESLEEAIDQGRASTWDRIIPLKGTGEETMTHWHGSRHIEIVRQWAKDLRSYCLEQDEKALVDLFLDLSEAKAGK